MRTIAERYELAGSLGSGGMAHVHRAHDTVLQRDVALKLLREEVAHDSTLRERFLREARLAGSLTNRYVVRVYDAGVDGSTPWMAMELVDGPSLRERMSERGPYPLADAMPIFEQVLEALEAAHSADVIHRDIKPANILLSPDGAKLGDFGIAKSIGTVGADLTQFNQFLGTPKYTAPEVAMGNPATRRSDVYAAAVVFWEMLAGHPPYDHPNALTLAMMHRTDPLPSLAAVRGDLPPTLIAALEGALEKEPGRRPADAATFSRNLREGADGPPRPPMPPPTPAPPTAPTLNVVRTQRLPSPTLPPPTASTPAASDASGRSAGWGLAVLVAVLIGAAVVAFTLANGDTEVPTTPTPGTTAPSVTPSGSPTAPVPEDPDPAAPAPAPQPTAPTPGALPPAPSATPTSPSAPTTPPASPTTAPPTAQPTAQPTPTAAPTPLIDVPFPGGGPSDGGTDPAISSG